MSDNTDAALFELLAVIQPHITDGAEVRRIAELLEQLGSTMEAAVIWWRRAADMGDADAKDYLSVLIDEGIAERRPTDPT
ncbi:hypothetical protein [Streptomyces sp. NPDC058280]|uniref:hypothetical protein n=1 Tax=Streptomyces sp. NPDC058280 TaxID=3346419 RepID=UPI0036ED93FF